MTATREWLSPRLLLRLAVLAAVVTLAAGAVRAVTGWSPLARFASRPPRVTHEMVVERVKDVAKLVSTEMTVRDVVTFDQSRFGMRKRALLVVTGRVLAGIDLQKGTDVRIDDAAKRITIVLPPAEVLAVDVLRIQTYDEQSGLFNPFRPEDRDLIQMQIRNKLIAAGQQSGLLPQASRSAKTMLEALLARDGYTVNVQTPAQLVIPGAR